MASDFLPPPRKGKNRKRTGQLPTFETQLQRTTRELDTDGWCESVRELINSTLLDFYPLGVFRIVCLGLGSPTNSILSRAQLALLIQLADRLGIPKQDATLYDPAFNQEDIKVIQKLGFIVLEEEDEDIHVSDNATLFFMPHCEHWLYEKVVRKNWSQERISRTIFLGNQLGEYSHILTENEFQEKSPLVHKLVPYLHCVPIPPCPTHPNAFNNLALQGLRTGTQDALITILFKQAS